MPYYTRYADHFRDWQELVTTLEQNEVVLPHLTLPRQKLEGLLAEAQEMAILQATHAARKQEASSRLATVVNQGIKLATFLRVGVKEHFGNRSEKLAEYRIQPFRGRFSLEAPPPEGPESPAPIVPE